MLGNTYYLFLFSIVYLNVYNGFEPPTYQLLEKGQAPYGHDATITNRTKK